MRRRVLNFDPERKIQRVFHPDGDRFHVETKQDITALVEHNKAVLAANSTGFKGDFHRVACIPISVYMDLWQKGIAQDEKAFARWLNDRDNKVFRVKEGRLAE